MSAEYKVTHRTDTKRETIGILRGYPTTSISRNNVRKCLLESDNLVS